MLMLTYFSFSRHNRENDLFLWVTGNNTFKAIKYRHSDQLRAMSLGLHCEQNQFQMRKVSSALFFQDIQVSYAYT